MEKKKSLSYAFILKIFCYFSLLIRESAFLIVTYFYSLSGCLFLKVIKAKKPHANKSPLYK